MSKKEIQILKDEIARLNEQVTQLRNAQASADNHRRRIFLRCGEYRKAILAIRDYAEEQRQMMNRDSQSRNSRPPDGVDWNNLYCKVKQQSEITLNPLDLVVPQTTTE